MRSRKLMATVLSTALAMNSLSGAAVTKADSDGSTGEARRSEERRVGKECRL